MHRLFSSDLFFYLCLAFIIVVWSYWVISTHPLHAIVSWDEGFHGGAALFVTELIKNHFNMGLVTYILTDFKNGLIWYLPLWSVSAGILGAIFGSSLELYRFTTLIFAVLTIIIIAFFSKAFADIKAGLLACTLIAMTPVVIVYSHLMMLEIPLMFSVTFALLTFYRYLTKSKIAFRDKVFFVFVLFIGISTKVVAAGIIFSVILTFGIFVYFTNNQLIKKRFFSKTIFISFILTFLLFNLYRYLDKTLLNADFLTFHLTQSEKMGNSFGFLESVKQNIFNNLFFYFTDFKHMPILSIFWFSSLIGYLILKRSLLSLYLILWAVLTYLIFTAIKPQSVQYVLSIHVPLTIGSALFWAEFLKYRNKIVSFLVFLLLIFFIIWQGILNLDRTETIVWRKTITNQDQVVSYIVKNASLGDRVISSGDGTRFLVRIYGLDKKIQTINGAAKNCKQFIQDNVEWGILDKGLHNPIYLVSLTTTNWKLVKSYTNLENQPEKILRNTNFTRKVDVNEEEFDNYCPRMLPLGKNEIIFVVTPTILGNNKGKQKLILSLRANILKSLIDFPIDQEALNSQNGHQQTYKFDFYNSLVNKPVFVSLSVPTNVLIDISRLEINSLDAL